MDHVSRPRRTSPSVSPFFSFSSPVTQPSSSPAFSLPTTSFTFSVPSTSASATAAASNFAFSLNSSSAINFSPAPQSPESSGVSSESTPPIYTPSSSRGSTVASTRTLFSALDLSTNHRQRRTEPGFNQGDPQGSGSLAPTLNVATYRDLYNATPTPQSRSCSNSSTPAAPNAPRSDTSRLGSVASDFRDLAIQSIENAPGQAEEDNESDNNSAGDSDLESDDDNLMYNVREEALPQAPIYDVGLQNALREVRSHLTNLKLSMARSGLVHNESTKIHELYKQVESMSRFEYPETRIVAFIGDSGVGKSSLINSLLDHDGLARTSANGIACTSVVTEFRHIDETHRDPFTVEADFMNMDELRELLQELLRAYRMHHTNAFHEVTDREERDRITSLSVRSWETLKSLFPNEADMTEQFLSNEDAGAESIILERLEEWARAGLAHRPGGPDALNSTIPAANIQECRENLDTLTVSSHQPGRPAVWPFVKLIRVYLNSPILRTGLVVADVPGFRDLNYARVRATEGYLRSTCEEIFVVSEISRCISDTSISDIKNRLVRGQPLRVVCTKSESSLNIEELIRDSDMPSDVMTRAQELSDRIESTQRSLERMSRRRRSSGTHVQLAIRETETRDELERLGLQLKQLLVGARNQSVTTVLSNRYQPDVKVFCVSSKLYTDHRHYSGEQAREYIQLSEIPDLRRYCQSVPAEAQLRATASFLNNRVPGLLLSLNQWVLSGSSPVTVERAATLRRVLDEAQKTVQARLTSRDSCVRFIQGSLHTQFANSIIRGIRTSQGRWKIGAVRASQNWATMYHQTYAAFCRKYGIHQPSGQQLRCWNEEVLQEANDDLVENWGSLQTWLYEQQDIVRALVADTFNSVYETLEEHVHLAPAQLENLLDGLEAQKHIVLDTIQRAFDDLLVHTERITQDVLNGHNSTSHIAVIMRPAYNACQAESGAGSDARRKRIMDQHVRNPQIFLRFSNNIQTAYEDMMNTVFSELRQRLGEEMQNITRDLGVAITDEGEIPETDQDPELAERVRAERLVLQARLDEARSILQGLQNGGEN
ncbi:hypothetical protein BJX63DRAFT_395031 [Aspergillus granulosus]|uniref:GED domain-containing protein n=1 Tax=Aspergillus granulosus TaxID=176169 RepID=A0ABR4HCC3_9EURO